MLAEGQRFAGSGTVQYSEFRVEGSEFMVKDAWSGGQGIKGKV
jgi:hypothetical protein